MPKFQSLKGFRDFYPEDFAKRAYITDTWRRVAKSFGFLEYDAPPLETLDLYRHKSGDELVGQLYSFVDKGGREVALRPEMTPSVARMVSERWQTLPKPVRWFSIPQLFRYERPQAGRLREHFQFNVDIFGDDSSVAEAELLAVLISALKAFRLSPDDVEIRLSDRRVLNLILKSLGFAEEHQSIAYAVLDKFDREDRESGFNRLVSAGVQESAARALFEAVERFRNAEGNEAFEAQFGQEHAFGKMWYELTSQIADAKSWITFDLAIVRGLGYYTGTVFEVFDRRGKYRAICGGGRYDALLESLGGPSAAAIGFGWGDVVLTSLLTELGKWPDQTPSVDFLVYSGSGMGKEAEYARMLRDLGFSARSVWSAVGNKVQKQDNPSITSHFHYVIDDPARVIDCAQRKSVPLQQHTGLISALEREISERGMPSPTRIWQIAQGDDLRLKPQV